MLTENLGGKRILLNDDQRRRLAVKGTMLGRKRLEEIGTLVTPDTILRWHRMLVAKKWDDSERGKPVGRPRVKQEIADLALRFAHENPSWVYDRIQGALANLGRDVSDQTVGNILKQHPPVPGTLPWRTQSSGARQRLHSLRDQKCIHRPQQRIGLPGVRRVVGNPKGFTCSI